MKIEYAAPIPEKPHVLHVGLRYEKAVDGEDKINEVPVRKSAFEALTAARKLAYVCECERWHFKRDATVRAKWDAGDKAAEEAKFVMRHVATTADGVTVSVTWQGLTAQHVIPNDPATAEANAKALHQAEKAKLDAEAAVLAAFNVG